MTVGREKPVNRAISSRVDPCAVSKMTRARQPSLADGGGAYATALFGKFFKAKRNVQNFHQELFKVGIALEV